jgi:hypothetical protein
MLDSLVRVSRRVGSDPIGGSRRGTPGLAAFGAARTLRPALRRTGCRGRRSLVWAAPHYLRPLRSAHVCAELMPVRQGSESVTVKRFQVLFTLFPKFFSTFPHGTCLLSVSRGYLAFGRVYFRIGVAIPSSSTLASAWVGSQPPRTGALTLSGIPFHGTLVCLLAPTRTQVTIRLRDFNMGSIFFTRRY